ncbi:hypothetical protein GCM10023334_043220 [Nonomuraea thailandensis]
MLTTAFQEILLRGPLGPPRRPAGPPGPLGGSSPRDLNGLTGLLPERSRP